MEELGGVSAAVEGDVSVVDCKELGGEGGGPRDEAVVAAELDEEEDEEAGDGADGRDVEQVLDVPAIPRRRRVDRRKRRRREGGDADVAGGTH